MGQYGTTWHFWFSRIPDEGEKYDNGRDIVSFVTRGLSVVEATALAWDQVVRQCGERMYPRTLEEVNRSGGGS